MANTCTEGTLKMLSFVLVSAIEEHVVELTGEKRKDLKTSLLDVYDKCGLNNWLETCEKFMDGAGEMPPATEIELDIHGIVEKATELANIPFDVTQFILPKTIKMQMKEVSQV